MSIESRGLNALLPYLVIGRRLARFLTDIRLPAVGCRITRWRRGQLLFFGLRGFDRFLLEHLCPG